MESLDVRFEGVVWLLQETKSAFYAPRYSQERLLVRSQVFSFWQQPQNVLELGEVGEYLVLTAVSDDASKLSGDPKETKKLLKITVRPLGDIRRAQLYQTAVRTQTLELFVDVEHTRERLLTCLQSSPNEGGMRQNKAPHTAAVASTGKKLLDDAFAAVERAQQSREKETALRLYREAETGFYEAERLVTDERSRQFLSDRRGDLQRTIRGLEEQINGRVGAATTAAPPPFPAAVVPPPQTEVETVTNPATCNISARLEELRRFAAQQDNKRVQENGADLASRLAALKNEKAGPAPPMDDLAERLRRLRGDNGPPEGMCVTEDVNVEKKNAVDRIIEQVTDEIALGIDDEDGSDGEGREENGSGRDNKTYDSSSSSNSRSSSSSSSRTSEDHGKLSNSETK